MSRFIPRFMNMSCKEATMLIARKEESKLSFLDRVGLSLHLSMCTLCRRFERQSVHIAKESRHVHSEEELSAEAKLKILRSLDDSL